MTTIKGKALRQDLAHYDGINLKGSRKDSTGGFIKGTRIGDEVDVFMVYGEAYTGQTIQNAINSIGSKSATLKFSPGTWEIEASVTIPSNLSVRVPAGVVFNVASGKTLTFQGPVFRDSETWTSGSGTVTESWSRTENGTVTFTGTTNLGGKTSIQGPEITASVSSDDLTVSLQTDGAAISASNELTIRFRSTTLTSGVHEDVTFSAATSVVLPATGTLGFSNSETGYIHVYACYDGTNKEIGLVRRILDEGVLRNTTAIGTGSDTVTALYTTSALTNAAIRLIGRIKITHGTAVWDANPTEVTAWTPGMSTEIKGSYTGTLTGIDSVVTTTINFSIVGDIAMLQIDDNATGTSDATTFTITGSPAVIWPDNNTQMDFCILVDNNAIVRAEVRMQSTGVLQFSVLGVTTGFTASSGKGISSTRSVGHTYKLTNPA